MEYRPSDLSIIGFLDENKIVNERGERISFYDRPFLYEPMCDWSRFQCYKKAAQGIGMSVTMALKTFYAAKYKGWGVIHSFPTDSDSSGFVKTKVNKILQVNKCFGEIDSDSVELKMYGDRPIHYQGTGSKSGAISKTVDVIVEDEKDRSDQSFLNDLESRTINSKFKGVWSLSNPSVDGAGVDADWQQSDKKEWFVTCSNGHAHFLTWPESVDIKAKKYICRECGVELSDDDRRRGKWIPTGPKDAKFSGYHMTLMFAPLIPASYLIEQWDEGKNPEYFNNFILGEPYSPGDTKIDKQTILDSWTPKNIVTGQYFLGVDVGNIRHYVLGSEKGIIEIGTFTGQAKLDEMLERYHPTTVMDAMPENTMSQHYRETMPDFFICHLGRDKENNTVIRFGKDDKAGLIFADKHRAIDRMVDELLSGKILFSVPNDQAFRKFIEQCGDLRRIKEVDSNGVERYIWDSLTKDDHGAFALLFYWMAKQTAISGAGSYITGYKQPQAIIQTKDGFKLNLIEELENRAIYGRDISENE
jgi:hypothetical protein